MFLYQNCFLSIGRVIRNGIDCSGLVPTKVCFQIVWSEVGLVATKKKYQNLTEISTFWVEWADNNLIINNCIKLRVSPKKIDFQPDTADFFSTLVNFLLYLDPLPTRQFENKL